MQADKSLLQKQLAVVHSHAFHPRVPSVLRDLRTDNTDSAEGISSKKALRTARTVSPEGSLG